MNMYRSPVLAVAFQPLGVIQQQIFLASTLILQGYRNIAPKLARPPIISAKFP
jgi:hypothetical protein